METDVVTILLAMLGSSVLTALITVLGKRKTDQATVNDILLENAGNDIKQIRAENAELRARINELEKKIEAMKNDLEEREILIRIAEKENLELRSKVESLEEKLVLKNQEIAALEGRIQELEKKLEEVKRDRVVPRDDKVEHGK